MAETDDEIEFDYCPGVARRPSSEIANHHDLGNEIFRLMLDDEQAKLTRPFIEALA